MLPSGNPHIHTKFGKLISWWYPASQYSLRTGSFRDTGGGEPGSLPSCVHLEGDNHHVPPIQPFPSADPLWYHVDAILYEVHVRAFNDSNGDGHGRLPGTPRLSSIIFKT